MSCQDDTEDICCVGVESKHGHDEEWESQLIRKEYWADVYESELENFNEDGHEGEEWFQQDCTSLAEWIERLPGVQKEMDRVLDVGCGNGLFLIRLASKFFSRHDLPVGCEFGADGLWSYGI